MLLVGQTPTASLRVIAEKIARSTPKKCYAFYNEVSISNPIPLTQRTKDSWITSQVRSNMLTKRD